MIQHISKINNAEVFTYIQKGSAIPVVFIHGFCEDSSVWFELINDFPDSNIICIDLPGFGKSDVQMDCNIADMANIVNDVLESLEINECIFIGHSMGGYIGLEFLKLFPQKCLGLGLFHSQPFADTEDKKNNRRKSIEFIQKNGSIHYVKQLIPKLFSPRFGSKSSFTISKLVLTASQYSSDGIINALNAMILREDNSSVLSQTNIPILFIVGEDDEAVPKSNSFQQLSIPNQTHIRIILSNSLYSHLTLWQHTK